jgi:hypothetical protein
MTDTVTIRITPTIHGEYESRCPEGIDHDALRIGSNAVTRAQARLILDDATHNSDPKAFDIGEYGMPLGTFNAYRALVSQVRKVLGAAS